MGCKSRSCFHIMIDLKEMNKCEAGCHSGWFIYNGDLIACAECNDNIMKPVPDKLKKEVKLKNTKRKRLEFPLSAKQTDVFSVQIDLYGSDWYIRKEDVEKAKLKENQHE